MKGSDRKQPSAGPSRRYVTFALAVAGLWFLPVSTVHAEAGTAVDWDAVTVQTLPLFQPGQGSWEWLLMPANHGAGARRMREGRTCLSCHAGEERTIGQRIGSGEVLEPDPMTGMPGVIDVDFAITRDAENLYVRLSWAALTDAPKAGDSETPARATVMLGGESLSIARVAGCWASCHNDSPGMADAHAEKLTKYLPNSRNRMTATGGGVDLRSDADLADELAAGRYLEYWQAKFDADGVQEVVDGYFLEARNKNDAPELTANARRDGDRWVVEMTRPLVPAGGPRMTLRTGEEYTVAIAVHDNHATHRNHYVAFPKQVRLGSGDVVVVTEADDG